MARILLLLAPLIIINGAVIYFIFLKSPPPLPDYDLNEWWGPEKLKEKQDTSINPFKVKFSDSMIQDLRARLKSRSASTPPLEGVGFEYGFNSAHLDSWVKYWAEEYPFQKREEFLNKFPQYKTNIQGLDLHFIRVKPKVVPIGVEIIPLLLIHGWPGSVREFYESIPLITAASKERNFAVEVIVPSLPGYGFSAAAVRPGLGADKMAVVLRNLMQRLGFKQYYVQGGDWGSIIGSNLATLFPKEVLGYHTNAPITFSTTATVLTLVGSFFPSLIVESHLADRLYPLSKNYAFMLEESGYLHLQSTKPDTVGVALSDSPVGLLAYILEKFSTWTNRGQRALADGGITSRFTREQLIDNLMLYWSTSTITTSMRLYSETFNKRFFELKFDEIPTPVPTWGLQAAHELQYVPPYLLRFKYSNLLNLTVVDDGGHFFAFELPQLFAEDVLLALREFRKFNGKSTPKTEL